MDQDCPFRLGNRISQAYLKQLRSFVRVDQMAELPHIAVWVVDVARSSRWRSIRMIRPPAFAVIFPSAD